MENNVIFFAPTIDTTNCEIIAECDCCAWEIAFINKTEFIEVSYCMDEISVSKGTYQVDNKKINLSYNGFHINKLHDEKKEARYKNKDTAIYTWSTTKIKPFNNTLSKMKCKNKKTYYASSESGEDRTFGYIDNKQNTKKFIGKLKKEGIGNRLGF